MSEIVNLRQFRKRRLREEKERIAAENRVRHGRSKTVRDFEERDLDASRNFLDQNKLSDKPDP